MILSASRRTDLPCYYSDWFLNRLEAGFVDFRNPVNPKQLYRLHLSPDTIDCIVFWTKDPWPLLEKLIHIDRMGYRYYFQFTITPYDRKFERYLRNKEEIIETFQRLSSQIGAERVIWRYDPIILNQWFTSDDHYKGFTYLCEQLHPFTRQVIFSFIDLYKKIKSPFIQEPNIDQAAELALFLSETAKRYDLIPSACCEPELLNRYGIQQASCIDKGVIESVCGISMDLKLDRHQRKGCKCCESIDIGAYNTCQNGCIYCYANYSDGLVADHVSHHDPHSSLLIGSIEKGDHIIFKEAISNRSGQLSFY